MTPLDATTDRQTLELLIAGGHVTQAKVDEARQIIAIANTGTPITPAPLQAAADAGIPEPSALGEVMAIIQSMRYRSTGCFCLGILSHTKNCGKLTKALARLTKEVQP